MCGAAAKLTVTPLPHGLLERTETVQTCSAIYHLVVVFGNPSTELYQNVTDYIKDTETMLKKEQFKSLQYAVELLKQLRNRVELINRNPYSTTGAVARVTHPSPVTEKDSGTGLLIQPSTESSEENQKTGSWTQPSSARSKRGLFDFVGTVSKTLFGIETEHNVMKMKNIVDMNRSKLSVMSHKMNEMLTVVNATRSHMLENRHVINQLIQSSSEMKEWYSKIQLRQHLYQALLFKINVIQNLVEDLERNQDKMLRIRKDLERGFLSEDLLPIDELKSLQHSVSIPKGSKFVSPLYWYYSKLTVRVLRIENEIVYSVDLPLVNNEHTVAKQIVSYPTPNVNSNVTLQIMTDTNRLFLSHTGKPLTKCIGHKPLVCPPTALSRGKHIADHSCASALLNPNKDVSHLCPTKVTSEKHDQLYYHSVNTFVLVTWGTDVIEGCLNSKMLSLKPGTYLVSWSGSCALCTKHHCVPGVIQASTSLKLNYTWQVFRIPKVQNFSELNIPVTLPEVMATPQVMKLSKLIAPPIAPGMVWSKEDTSITIDMCIVFIVLCIISIISAYAIYKYVCKHKKSKVAKVNEEQTIPLTESNKTSNLPLSPQQAAAILIANQQKSQAL